MRRPIRKRSTHDNVIKVLNDELPIYSEEDLNYIIQREELDIITEIEKQLKTVNNALFSSYLNKEDTHCVSCVTSIISSEIRKDFENFNNSFRRLINTLYDNNEINGYVAEHILIKDKTDNTSLKLVVNIPEFSTRPIEYRVRNNVKPKYKVLKEYYKLVCKDITKIYDTYTEDIYWEGFKLAGELKKRAILSRIALIDRPIPEIVLQTYNYLGNEINEYNEISIDTFYIDVPHSTLYFKDSEEYIEAT
jgi:hypothetical protein